MSESNPAAVALNKLRWSRVSAKDRKAWMLNLASKRKYSSEQASIAAKSITPAAAKARAEKAAETRRKNARKRKKTGV